MYKVRPIGFLKTVGAAGTQERLTDSSHTVRAVLITAKPGNSGYVYVGDKDVSSTRHGVCLDQKESVEMTTGDLGWPEAEMPLNEIWLDVSSSGDGVSVMYFDVTRT